MCMWYRRGREGGISLALPWELGNTSYPHAGPHLTPLFVLDFSSSYTSPIMPFLQELLLRFSSLPQFLVLTSKGSKPHTPLPSFSSSPLPPTICLCLCISPSHSSFDFIITISPLHPPWSSLDLLWAQWFLHLFRIKQGRKREKNFH